MSVLMSAIFPVALHAHVCVDRTTPIGTLINLYLNDKTSEVEPHAVHLLFSANRWERKYMPLHL